MTLVGKRIVLMVGEPWDFESPDGENVINARIMEVGNRRGQFCIVAESQYEVEVPDLNARGRRFLMSTRYEGDRIGDIAKGRDVTVGVAIVPPAKSDYAAIHAMIGAVFLKDFQSKFQQKD
jgi:hypothetical protein